MFWINDETVGRHGGYDGVEAYLRNHSHVRCYISMDHLEFFAAAHRSKLVKSICIGKVVIECETKCLMGTYVFPNQVVTIVNVLPWIEEITATMASFVSVQASSERVLMRDGIKRMSIDVMYDLIIQWIPQQRDSLVELRCPVLPALPGPRLVKLRTLHLSRDNQSTDRYNYLNYLAIPNVRYVWWKNLLLQEGDRYTREQKLLRNLRDLSVSNRKMDAAHMALGCALLRRICIKDVRRHIMTFAPMDRALWTKK